MEWLSSYTDSFSATREVLAMRGKTKEVWENLCEQAAVKQDPDKLMLLVQQINGMLDEKERRLTARDHDNAPPNT
jgi:hypothetical protein